MKFQLFLLISCLIVLSQQYNQKPQPDSWQPESDWSYEPAPKPRNPCNCIPKSDDVEFTPIVEVEVSHDTKLNCDAKSKIKQLVDQSVAAMRYTCNGVVVDTNDYVYNAVIGGGYGGKNTEILTVTNYTSITSINNGNNVFQECGVIVGGKCSGDILIGTAIREANDQKGCCKGGITGASALERQIDIKGKCASSCTLDTSTWAFAEPVSNYGLGDRSNAVETHE